MPNFTAASSALLLALALKVKRSVWVTVEPALVPRMTAGLPELFVLKVLEPSLLLRLPGSTQLRLPLESPGPAVTDPLTWLMSALQLIGTMIVSSWLLKAPTRLVDTLTR